MPPPVASSPLAALPSNQEFTTVSSPESSPTAPPEEAEFSSNWLPMMTMSPEPPMAPPAAPGTDETLRMKREFTTRTEPPSWNRAAPPP